MTTPYFFSVDQQRYRQAAGSEEQAKIMTLEIEQPADLDSSPSWNRPGPGCLGCWVPV